MIKNLLIFVFCIFIIFNFSNCASIVSDATQVVSVETFSAVGQVYLILVNCTNQIKLGLKFGIRHLDEVVFFLDLICKVFELGRT